MHGPNGVLARGAVAESRAIGAGNVGRARHVPIQRSARTAATSNGRPSAPAPPEAGGGAGIQGGAIMPPGAAPRGTHGKRKVRRGVAEDTVMGVVLTVTAAGGETTVGVRLATQANPGPRQPNRGSPAACRAQTTESVRTRISPTLAVRARRRWPRGGREGSVQSPTAWRVVSHRACWHWQAQAGDRWHTRCTRQRSVGASSAARGDQRGCRGGVGVPAMTVILAAQILGATREKAARGHGRRDHRDRRDCGG